MKSILRFIIIILIALAILYIKDDVSRFLLFQDDHRQTEQVTNQSASVLSSQPSSTAPLKVGDKWLSNDTESNLNASGIVKYSNLQRSVTGLSELKPNQKLNESASLKLNDMVARQYFDHVNPDQIGINNLGEEVDYAYIIMGENLAYGDFRNDESLVKAWMESPSHRANIMNKRYSEIGVAVKKVNFQGKDTWVAVQHFGLPLNGCPEIDQQNKLLIEQNTKRIEEISSTLNLQNGGAATVMLAQILNFKEVREYNRLVNETKKIIDIYNSQVASFNDCINH